jgi:hypothetical protein
MTVINNDDKKVATADLGGLSLSAPGLACGTN